MPDHSVTLYLMVQCAQCRVVWQHQVQGVMSLAQVIGIHSIDNCVALGKHCCKCCWPYKRYLQDLLGPGQALVVAGVSGAHTLGCRNQFQVPI